MNTLPAQAVIQAVNPLPHPLAKSGTKIVANGSVMGLDAKAASTPPAVPVQASHPAEQTIVHPAAIAGPPLATVITEMISIVWRSFIFKQLVRQV